MVAREWGLGLFALENLTEYSAGGAGVFRSLYVRCIELMGFQGFGEKVMTCSSRSVQIEEFGVLH